MCDFFERFSLWIGISCFERRILGGRVVKKNPKNFSFTENTQLALTQAFK
jgi:hypothetical protein